MKTDKEPGNSQKEVCPFCGRSFKRLKTHLAHCKMAPVAKETKGSKTASEPKGSTLLVQTTKMTKRSTATKQERFSDRNLTEALLLPSASLKVKVTSLPQTTEVGLKGKKCGKPHLPQGASVVKPKVREKAGAVGKDRGQKPKDDKGTEFLMSKQKGRQKGHPSLIIGDCSIKTAEDETKRLFRTVDRTEQTKISLSLKSKPKQSPLPPSPSTRDGTVVKSAPLDLGTMRVVASEAQVEPAPRRTHTYINIWEDIPSSATSTESPPKNESCPKLLPMSVGTKPCSGPHSPAGLEWMPELSAGYRNIGFSMLSLRPITEPVQVKPLTPENQVSGRLAIISQLQAGGNHPWTRRGGASGGATTNGGEACRTARLANLATLTDPQEWRGSYAQSLPAVSSVGWQWYYRKYIDVRRGGVGGIAMLLAAYCTLGYIWSYPRLKHERWRKYH